MKQGPAFFVQNNYVERLTEPVASFARKHGVALEDRSSSQGFDPDDRGIWLSAIPSQAESEFAGSVHSSR